MGYIVLESGGRLLLESGAGVLLESGGPPAGPAAGYFAAGVYGRHYFPPRYFPSAPAAPAGPAAGYFAAGFYPGHYFARRYFAGGNAPAVAAARTIAQAIHGRLDDTPALAALLGHRHWDVASPLAGITPTPYLVMNQLGRRVAGRTTTGVLVVRKYMFRVNYVDSSSLAADLFPDAFGAAFNHHMDPLLVAGKRVLDVEIGDAITQDALGRGGDQKARIQVTLPLDLLVLEPL